MYAEQPAFSPGIYHVPSITSVEGGKEDITPGFGLEVWIGSKMTDDSSNNIPGGCEV